jgi:hypothetical protein
MDRRSARWLTVDPRISSYRGGMIRRIMVGAVLVPLLLAACEVIEPVRYILELDVEFERGSPTAEAIDREVALGVLTRHLREADQVLGRPPDRVEFGHGRCPDDKQCMLSLEPQPRAVWMVEWTPDTNPDVYGLYLVDAIRGEVIMGWGHGVERHEREEPLERHRRIEEAPGPGGGGAQ